MGISESNYSLIAPIREIYFIFLNFFPQILASLANNKSAPNDPNSARQRPKLTTKMKSLSLDCAEMPPTMVQLGMRPQYSKL